MVGVPFAAYERYMYSQKQKNLHENLLIYKI